MQHNRVTFLFGTYTFLHTHRSKWLSITHLHAEIYSSNLPVTELSKATSLQKGLPPDVVELLLAFNGVMEFLFPKSSPATTLTTKLATICTFKIPQLLNATISSLVRLALLQKSVLRHQSIPWLPSCHISKLFFKLHVCQYLLLPAASSIFGAELKCILM